MGNRQTEEYVSSQNNRHTDDLQTFLIKGHRNKIFGCDAVMPHGNSGEVWVASCSADGRLLIHEVFIETKQQKQFRHKLISSQTTLSLINNRSKSQSSLRAASSPFILQQNISARYAKPAGTRNQSSNSMLSLLTKSRSLRGPGKPKALEIEINRILTIPLDSSVCYTVSLHSSCRYVSTCINKRLLIFEIDLNAESSMYHEVKLAKKYISGAKFVSDQLIIFSSGDGRIYLYNFIFRCLLHTIKYHSLTRTRDILCMDHAELRLDRLDIARDIVVAGTLDGHILIYDVSHVIRSQIEHEGDPEIVMQDMYAQFGAEISCLSVSNDGKFIAVGAEDNTYNVYGVSVLEDESVAGSADAAARVKWVLLYKQAVVNDANINHVSWINNNTLVATCDRGRELYVTTVLDVRDDMRMVNVLANVFMREARDACSSAKREEGERSRSSLFVEESAIEDDRLMAEMIADVVLDYVVWSVSDYKQQVIQGDDFISCIATNCKVNDGAGFVVIGGFNRMLQCFLPLVPSVSH